MNEIPPSTFPLARQATLLPEDKAPVLQSVSPEFKTTFPKKLPSWEAELTQRFKTELKRINELRAKMQAAAETVIKQSSPK